MVTSTLPYLCTLPSTMPTANPPTEGGGEKHKRKTNSREKNGSKTPHILKSINHRLENSKKMINMLTKGSHTKSKSGPIRTQDFYEDLSSCSSTESQLNDDTSLTTTESRSMMTSLNLIQKKTPLEHQIPRPMMTMSKLNFTLMTLTLSLNQKKTPA